MLLTNASVADAGSGRLPKPQNLLHPEVDLGSPEQRPSAYLVLSWCPRMGLEMVLREQLWVHQKADDRKAAGQGRSHHCE